VADYADGIRKAQAAEIERAALAERKLIVKWLRDKPSHTMAASAIERGEHLK
jgi:hypothetical protein